MYHQQGVGPYMVTPGARLDIGPRGGLYETMGNPGITDVLYAPTTRTLAFAAMAYHGYKRTNSGWWALLWAMFGSAAPVLAVPIAIAQGFAKPKGRK